ncbi:MAG: 50S ribosomal protein L13 [Candidatus Marinimicrobia bacterium]|jgi:large subunit ribosomal protein L13|nr:50S ribosomal protein L13 [Candidatus Neomarinimicrobiota bacterium]|tara:strand:- start:27 stop:464 length:438 start_codon:yes stop_codon:yes gene_type:complete
MKKITKTISAKDVHQQWWLFDASDKVLGRFASEVAQVLRGKHRADYSPNIYMGDAVIIVNADKIRVTGNKSETKKYFRHSGYPGGVKYASFSDLMKNDSDKVVLNAVKGMLPKNKLGREISKHIRIYKDTDHGHEAQQPKEWSSN